MAWSNPLTTIINATMRRPEQYAYNTSLTDKLSESTRKRHSSFYQDSIGLPPINTVERVNAYLDARLANLPSGSGPYPATPDLAQLTSTFSALDANIAQIGQRYHPGDLLTYLQKERAAAIKRIKAQQAADRAILEQTLAAPTVDANTRASSINSFTTNQQKELDAFEKGLTDDITQLHRASQSERDRVAVLASLRNGSESMRRLIDLAHLKGSPQATVGMAAEGEALSGVLIDDLIQLAQQQDQSIMRKIGVATGYSEIIPRFETITGHAIHAQKIDNGYSFKMQFPAAKSLLLALPPQLAWSGYYTGAQHQSKADLLVLAQLVKATGAKTVTVFMDYPNDEKMAMQMAREGFEAAREVGYAEKDIVIRVNGKVISADKLFEETPMRKQVADTRAQHASDSRAKPSQETMKREMEEARAEEAAKKAAPAASPSSTPSPGSSS